MEKPIIEWRAPEFEYREKGVSWYWLSIIAAIVILSVSVWQKNFLFAVFVVIAEILILVWAGRKPKEISFSLNEKGLTISGNKFYPYSAIENFSVREGRSEEYYDISLKLRHGFTHWLVVKTPTKNLAKIEGAISQFVEKTEHEDSFLDSLERLIGF
ncbi:MAG: hypothetical protein A3B13_01485 [Candidatus Liptonbacteria bacterium RIFCSPLOWO2_01_FULL_45_15]|uniref:DUF5673 domain-containing protein n=1 Tax=Candidatus Liptonbacteria bacterium RIFCSPLOWO2_01_FULL_45_15 TaxID=1798649 RepID=A0A1G2CFW7_9BACT|nr:MAG: hypothetical protein A3B13_01485 [Candidatus Liptonbacteria bacterium RIFCSPLOWO2_01_FULL_45_15]